MPSNSTRLAVTILKATHTNRLARLLTAQVLRRGPSLESERLGDITRGAMLQVVDEDLVDGVIRCHVGKDSSPRGVAVHNLGWVTAAKDGELKLTPIREDYLSPRSPPRSSRSPSPGREDVPTGTSPETEEEPIEMPWSLRLRNKLEAAHIDPSFSRMNLPSTTRESDGESMASRIANMRLEKQRRHTRHAAAASPAAAPEEEHDTDTPAKPKDTPPVEHKFVWASSAELAEHCQGLIMEADGQEEGAHAKFDTVEAQLGRLLNDRKIKLEDLMKEWDRNRDGDISKQEFRLHVKKLGLDTNTAKIDALYDSLDLDGSGSLDTEEMKEALRKMQDDVRNVKDSVNRVLEHVINLRKVIDLFKTAAALTLAVEANRFRLEAMRAAVKEDSAASRIAATLEARGLTLMDLDIGGWEADGKKFASAAALGSAFESLEAEVQMSEIAAFFKTLDFNSNDILEVEEVSKLLQSAGSKTTAAKQHQRKAEEVQQKLISSSKVSAEKAQKEARAAQVACEATRAQKEAAALEEQNAKMAQAKKKAKEEKAVKKKAPATMAKFMS